jgi:hypothetical protein
MKRELFEEILAIPYTAGDAVDRLGFLSAVLAVNVSSSSGGGGGNSGGSGSGNGSGSGSSGSGSAGSSAAPADNTAKTVKISVLHSDDEEGTFEPALDPRLFLNETIVERDNKGKISDVYANAVVIGEGTINLGIDLLGCKRYVEFVAATSATVGGLAVVLGDSGVNSV